MSGRRDLEKEQFWRLVVSEHGNSGLTVREFCERESISEALFYSWKRRLRLRDQAGKGPVSQGISKTATARRPALVPVTLVDPSPPTCCIEIVTPEGYTVRLPAGCDSEVAGHLLTALQRAGKATPSC